MLGTGVQKLVWSERQKHWDIELADGRSLVADAVVSAVGLFGAARYPDIEGIAEFSGELMHTSQWDAGVDLTGKRVAVVGTGASGVQVIPEVAAIAEQLTVFQRTPPWMVPKRIGPTTLTSSPASAGSRGPLYVRGGDCGSCSTTTRR